MPIRSKIRNHFSVALGTLLLAVGSATGVGVPAVAAATAVQTAPPHQGALTRTADDTSINPGNLPKPQASTQTIKHILQAFFAIAGAFAVLNITGSGMKYITAAGDPQRISEAKKGIVYALVGLMLAIAAEAIVAFVVKRGTPS